MKGWYTLNTSDIQRYITYYHSSIQGICMDIPFGECSRCSAKSRKVPVAAGFKVAHYGYSLLMNKPNMSRFHWLWNTTNVKGVKLFSYFLCVNRRLRDRRFKEESKEETWLPPDFSKLGLCWETNTTRQWWAASTAGLRIERLLTIVASSSFRSLM